MTRIAGVDEAGRGPIIGPMVIALVGTDESKIHILEKLGVKDSKLLTPSRRERLRRLLEQILDYVTIRVIQPQEIDEAVRGTKYKNLNHLELLIVAELIRKAVSEFKVERVYVDSPDPVPGRFEEQLYSIVNGNVEIVAENHADSRYTIVAAASIIAKTEREKLIEELKRTYGDFGSGYPSDPKTRTFVKKLLETSRELPPIVRKSWKTLERLR